MRAMKCSVHKKRLTPRAGATAEQRWCGNWYECPDGWLRTPGCNSVLIPSSALTGQLEQQRAIATSKVLA